MVTPPFTRAGAGTGPSRSCAGRPRRAVRRARSARRSGSASRASERSRCHPKRTKRHRGESGSLADEGTPREHQPGHARPPTFNLPAAIPSVYGGFVPAASRTCPSFPPRRSMGGGRRFESVRGLCKSAARRRFFVQIDLLQGERAVGTPALAERLRRCLAFNPTEWYTFSDHSPIVATFEGLRAPANQRRRAGPSSWNPGGTGGRWRNSSREARGPGSSRNPPATCPGWPDHRRALRDAPVLLLPGS